MPSRNNLKLRWLCTQSEQSQKRNTERTKEAKIETKTTTMMTTTVKYVFVADLAPSIMLPGRMGHERDAPRYGGLGFTTAGLPKAEGNMAGDILREIESPNHESVSCLRVM
jgi:hypothetical protein